MNFNNIIKFDLIKIKNLEFVPHTNSIIKNDFRIKDLIKTKIELKYFENDIGNVQKSNSFDDLKSLNNPWETMPYHSQR